MFGFIYLTTNKINGKRYVGKKTYKASNWKSYLGSGRQIKWAITKYGVQSFSREILEELPDKVALDAAERKWIAHFNAADDPMFYNLTPGGDGGSLYGKTHKEESKRKTSASMTGVPKSTSHRKQISESNYRRAKSYIVISPDGVEQIVPNIRLFCETVPGLHANFMRECARGKIDHVKGWKCRTMDVQLNGDSR